VPRGAVSQRPRHQRRGLTVTPVFDCRLSRPVILLRGLPAPAGSLRGFQADSRAGSARDAEKPAIVMSNTYGDLQDFYGSDGTRTRDLRRDRPVQAQPVQQATTRITRWSRRFVQSRTGCDRLRRLPPGRGIMPWRRCAGRRARQPSPTTSPPPSRRRSTRRPYRAAGATWWLVEFAAEAVSADSARAVIRDGALAHP
jgi:hypothetical protein